MHHGHEMIQRTQMSSCTDLMSDSQTDTATFFLYSQPLICLLSGFTSGRPRGQRGVSRSLQEPHRVDVQVVEEVGIRRASVGTLVLHQVSPHRFLTVVTLLHHLQLKQEIQHGGKLWHFSTLIQRFQTTIIIRRRTVIVITIISDAPISLFYRTIRVMSTCILVPPDTEYLIRPLQILGLFWFFFFTFPQHVFLEQVSLWHKHKFS